MPSTEMLALATLPRLAQSLDWFLGELARLAGVVGELVVEKLGIGGPGEGGSCAGSLTANRLGAEVLQPSMRSRWAVQSVLRCPEAQSSERPSCLSEAMTNSELVRAFASRAHAQRCRASGKRSISPTSAMISIAV